MEHPHTGFIPTHPEAENTDMMAEPELAAHLKKMLERAGNARSEMPKDICDLLSLTDLAAIRVEGRRV